jgi:hypothetical protein
MSSISFCSCSGLARRAAWTAAAALALFGTLWCAAQSGPAPDTLVLNNGDTIHGKLVKAVGGTVTFHNDALGDVTAKWTDIKELHTTQGFAVLNKNAKMRGRKGAAQIPAGQLDMTNQTLTVQAQNGAASAPVPVADAAYLIDQATLAREVFHQPGFLSGWTGAATAGATIVQATQNQYTASGSIGLMRTVPGVPWLQTRNRTSTDFSGSFGKLTAPGSPTVKTAIFHADAERDQYFSPRFFALAQVAFDHNFAQNLALQSVYGGGIGFTVLQKPSQHLDVKATIQYEDQQFIAGAASGNQNLIGSTFSANYMGTWKLMTLSQELAYVPAYNVPRAYSANETNTLSFPAYKNLSFSVGTLDSYLNDPPTTIPATKRNSFQFTMGLTYNIKSKY